MPYEVNVTVTSAAPPQTIFEHIACAESWPRWTAFPKAFRERAGTGEPDGVGAVRRIKAGPGGAREEVVAYEPYSHYAYRLLAGLPLLGYRADVTLTETASGGTELRWDGRFDRGKLPGTSGVLRVFMVRMLGTLAKGVAKHAESCPPDCPAHPAGEPGPAAGQ